MDSSSSDRSTRIHLRRPHLPQVGAAVLVLLLGLLYLASKDPVPDDAVAPSARPTPDVLAAPDVFRTLPESAPEVRDRLAADLSAALDDLYERAFLPPLPPPKVESSPGTTPSPAPTPIPRPPVKDLFTPPAAAALQGALDLFRTLPGERVTSGTVRFNGFMTVHEDKPLEAHVHVEFRGSGRVDVDGVEFPLTMTQIGQLTLVATPDGWRVFGYDVSLTAERLVPPPITAPSPDAALGPLRSTSARWEG